MSLMLYVDDVDAVFARAIAAGAEERIPAADQFYGDRSGYLEMDQRAQRPTRSSRSRIPSSTST